MSVIFVRFGKKLSLFWCLCKMAELGYPHDGRADKNSYPHDCRADKDSYRHDRRADKNPYRHDKNMRVSSKLNYVFFFFFFFNFYDQYSLNLCFIAVGSKHFHYKIKVRRKCERKKKTVSDSSRLIKSRD